MADPEKQIRAAMEGLVADTLRAAARVVETFALEIKLGTVDAATVAAAVLDLGKKNVSPDTPTGDQPSPKSAAR